MDKTRVLIIDDEPALSHLLTLHLLARDCYEVREEAIGMRSLETARRFHPDIILLDIVMPEIDGLDLACLLRNDPVIGEVPLIFLSASIPKEACGDLTGTINGFPFLLKPVSVDLIIEHIQHSLAHAPQPQGTIGTRPDVI